MKNLILLIAMIILAASAEAKETRDIVVVIDSGISSTQAIQPYMCSKPTLNFTNSKAKYDEHGHGTNIVSLIAVGINPKTQCILAVKVWHPKAKGYEVESSTVAALRIANRYKAKYINISMDGPNPVPTELKEIRQFLRRGGIMTVAAGNNKLDLDTGCVAFPSCYRKLFPHKNFHVVGASDTGSSNYGGVVTDIEEGKKKGFPVMSGTSQASAIKMSKILKDVVLNNRRK